MDYNTKKMLVRGIRGGPFSIRANKSNGNGTPSLSPPVELKKFKEGATDRQE